MARLNQRGSGRLGCLVWLLLIVSAGYWGLPIAQHYVAYFRLLDEMNTQARFAPSLDDAVIRRRLVLKADQLGLPPEARRFVIGRTSRPREIRIRTSYLIPIELPFYIWIREFTPTIVQGL